MNWISKLEQSKVNKEIKYSFIGKGKPEAMIQENLLNMFVEPLTDGQIDRQYWCCK